MILHIFWPNFSYRNKIFWVLVSKCLLTFSLQLLHFVLSCLQLTRLMDYSADTWYGLGLGHLFFLLKWKKKYLCYLGETNCESNWMPSLLKSTSVDGFLQVQQYQDNCLQVRELIENKESKERSLGQTPFTILTPKMYFPNFTLFSLKYWAL